MWLFKRQEGSLEQHYAGIAVVLSLHLLFIWALNNGLTSGLANKVVQIVDKPIETRIIEPAKRSLDNGVPGCDRSSRFSAILDYAPHW